MMLDSRMRTGEGNFHSTIKNQQSTIALQAIPPSLLRPDHEQFLSVLDRLAIGCQILYDLPGNVRLNLVQQLHRLDDAKDLPHLYRVTWLDERWRSWGRRFIERPYDWGLNLVQTLFRGRGSCSSRRSAGNGSQLDGRGRRSRHRVKAGFGLGVHNCVLSGALDTYFDVAAFKFELGDILLD